MITLNFDKNFKSLDGQVMDEHMGLLLAKLLSNATPGIEATKAMDWAYQLMATKNVNVDKTDKDKLEKFISSCTEGNQQKLTNLAAAQLLEVCKEA
jgi:hypothetical protein